MSNIGSALEKLRTEWLTLSRQWQTTRTLWQDSAQRNFEREFWTDFERIVPATLRELEELDEVIARARREVP